MKLFLDANILVAVLNKEYPLFTYAARIVSLADQRKYTVYTSPVCLAIAFYFAEKKSGTALAKQKIELLSKKIVIAEVGKNEVQQSIQHKKITDFEDGMEYFAALNSKCQYIVTEDIQDYYFSTIPVCRAREFLEEYVLK
ncbi:MAG: PIN domain-containing protein [Bacteroidetes bacterium]|nr:PIN domain-containing protein [Bacteroidota bacterium]